MQKLRSKFQIKALAILFRRAWKAPFPKLLARHGSVKHFRTTRTPPKDQCSPFAQEVILTWKRSTFVIANSIIFSFGTPIMSCQKSKPCPSFRSFCAKLSHQVACSFVISQNVQLEIPSVRVMAFLFWNNHRAEGYAQFSREKLSGWWRAVVSLRFRGHCVFTARSIDGQRWERCRTNCIWAPSSPRNNSILKLAYTYYSRFPVNSKVGVHLARNQLKLDFNESYDVAITFQNTPKRLMDSGVIPELFSH